MTRSRRHAVRHADTSSRRPLRRDPAPAGVFCPFAGHDCDDCPSNAERVCITGESYQGNP